MLEGFRSSISYKKHGLSYFVSWIKNGDVDKIIEDKIIKEPLVADLARRQNDALSSSFPVAELFNFHPAAY